MYGWKVTVCVAVGIFDVLRRERIQILTNDDVGGIVCSERMVGDRQIARSGGISVLFLVQVP